MDANGSGLAVGFLVVGVGFLGAQRAAAVAATRRARLVAVHDCDDARAQALATRLQTSHAIGYASALAADDVDAVIVATPHADHFEQAALALEAGKHVLCEKPLTIRPKQARWLATRADQLGLTLATGFNHRFYPPVRDALQLVSRWKLGRVESVRAEIGHMASPEFLSGWHTDPARAGGGTMVDNGPHACDLIRQFLGEVVAAKGNVSNRLNLSPGCESEAYALFRDHDRGFAEVRSSWTQPSGYLTIEVRGNQGHLRIETAPWRLTGKLADGRRLFRTYLAERIAERLFRRKYRCEYSLVLEIEEFIATIKGRSRSRLEASGWDGCRVTEMIDAIYRSDQTGIETPVQPGPVRRLGVARRRAAVEGQLT